MTNNILMVRNVFCPYKDHSSFLGGKLTMFKFCTYEFVLAKVSQVIFKIFWLILLFMSLIFLFLAFDRTIRATNVYFDIYDLFYYL
jgi:hypothetical protein